MRSKSLQGSAKDYYFEDYKIGSVYETDSVIVTEEEIIAFGKQFDPQYFHVDPIAAKGSMFGGLVSSGWHTCAIFMKLYVDNFVSPISSLGSPGVEQIRWITPVRPNDSLRLKIVIKEAKRSKTKHMLGIIVPYAEMYNQNGELVMTMTATNFFKCRNEET
jgi:acyl dehydratase